MKDDIKTIINELGHIVGTINEFDELEVKIAKLTDNELATLKAYIADEFNGKCNIRIDDVTYAISQLSTAHLYPAIKTPADFGRFMAHGLGMVDLDENFREFFDYEKYAESLKGWYVGRFTKDGFIWGEINPLPF